MQSNITVSDRAQFVMFGLQPNLQRRTIPPSRCTSIPSFLNKNQRSPKPPLRSPSLRYYQASFLDGKFRKESSLRQVTHTGTISMASNEPIPSELD
jgi:hypothetical protein